METIRDTDIAEIDADSGAADDNLPYFRKGSAALRQHLGHYSVEVAPGSGDCDVPQPFYLGRLRYWKLRDLAKWERVRAARRPPPRSMTA